MNKQTKSRPAMKKPTQGGLKRIKGFLSLELGLVLLVIAVLIAASVIYYRENIRKSSINANISHINYIGATAKTKYGMQNLYAQVTTKLAVQGGVIPAVLRDGTGPTATNPFGAAIAVTPVNLTGTNDAMRLDWPNTTNNQCSDIVSNVQGEFRQIQVGGVDVKPLDGKLLLETLENQCESSGTVLIQFWIGRT